ncbi:hypothetical protein BH23ACI1_BH23ACI1_30700 [soil metagenome]
MVLPELPDQHHVGALVRVHQPARRLQPVMLETEILDAVGEVVVTESRAIDAAGFQHGAAEHRFELPLRDLTPGDYLLRFNATSGEARAQRDVRFSVR